MKYGESTFDVIYLLFAVIIGILILKRKQGREGALMGSAVLVLGIGDAFHLVPRVLNYFIECDFSMWLGVGKLVTSITMTVFYVLMFHLYYALSAKCTGRPLAIILYVLAAARVIICLLPQNQWIANESSVTWGIIRNVPFVAIGAIIVVLYFGIKQYNPHFRLIWLWVTLSFMFYIPVAVFASIVPLFGMLMLPKTVCYMIIVWTFYRWGGKDK